MNAALRDRGRGATGVLRPGSDVPGQPISGRRRLVMEWTTAL